MKNKKIVVLVSAALVLVGFVLGTFAYNAYNAKKFSFLASKNSELFVRDYSPTMGAQDPKVYLVEFLDPECESCRVFAPYVKELMEEFKDQVQLVIRYVPNHPNSKFAVQILEAARKQGKYWEAMDVLFMYQPQWGDHHNPQPQMIWYYLPEANVDIAKIKTDMNDPSIIKNLEQDVADGQKLGVRGTPTFFVNGAPLKEFSRSHLRQAIVEALSK